MWIPEKFVRYYSLPVVTSRSGFWWDFGYLRREKNLYAIKVFCWWLGRHKQNIFLSWSMSVKIGVVSYIVALPLLGSVQLLWCGSIDGGLCLSQSCLVRWKVMTIMLVGNHDECLILNSCGSMWVARPAVDGSFINQGPSSWKLYIFK
jgi:hypothetical protein